MGDEIRPTAKVFDLVLTGDDDSDSVRDIGDDEQDFRRVHEEMVQIFKLTEVCAKDFYMKL